MSIVRMIDCVVVDNAGKCNILCDLFNFDYGLVTGMHTWNDYDIAAFDFRDSIALVDDCLDRHVAGFPFIDRWGR